MSKVQDARGKTKKLAEAKKRKKQRLDPKGFIWSLA